MRYVMKQKLISFGDDFTIRDENGRDVYFVDGKVFSLGDKLSLQDMDGNELAEIKEKLLSIGKTYKIYRNGEEAATIKKKWFSPLRDTFNIDVPGPDDLTARGNFLDYEYSFTRGGQPVAAVSKQWFSFSDTYGVETADGADDVLLLAAAVVIDLCSHDEE